MSLLTQGLNYRSACDDKYHIYKVLKGKKGKDVDLYSVFHVQDTSNAHFVTETELPGHFRLPPTACKHRHVQWPNNQPQAAPASNRSPPS